MTNIPHNSKFFNHLSLSERKIIQNLYTKGFSPSYIANILGRHRSTISRQLNNKKNTDFVRFGSKVKRTYVASIAQDNYVKNKSKCGAKYKLFNDISLIHFIEDAVINKKWSPQVAIGRAKLLGLSFNINISAKSIYNYIDRHQLNITPFHLRFRLRRKKPKKQYIKQNKKKLGKSIEERPLSVLNREEFGHWEGDTIVDKDSNSVFVLVERVSRKGFMLKLRKHTSDEVVLKLKQIKRKFGKYFKYIFKTITFDNGAEFYRVVDIEDSNLQIYFTHPYCSHEKGGVENYNGIIRRYIPKGMSIKKLTQESITRINEQIDNTPRKILNYKTSKECFDEYVKAIVN